MVNQWTSGQPGERRDLISMYVIVSSDITAIITDHSTILNRRFYFGDAARKLPSHSMAFLGDAGLRLNLPV